MANGVGKVFLIGAGPGDPGLFTIKGKQCLEQADVILYDQLVNIELLDYAGANAERIFVGKRSGYPCVKQEKIERLLITRARAGKTVARLKGGDPFVFGRGGEEAQALRRHGVPYEIVPGVSSAIAVPAYAGIPVTHRACSSSVAVVTGHKSQGGRGRVKWRELAHAVDTIVILMGLNNVREIMNQLLMGGCDGARPVALIESGTYTRQRMIVGTVSTIAGLAVERHIEAPAVIVVGEVVRYGNALEWFHNGSGDHRFMRLMAPAGADARMAPQ